jgi:hypothetical protein
MAQHIAAHALTTLASMLAVCFTHYCYALNTYHPALTHATLSLCCIDALITQNAASDAVVPVLNSGL